MPRKDRPKGPKKIGDGLFTGPESMKLELDRADARDSKGRIMYDCLNAVVVDGWIECRAGHQFSIRISFQQVLGGYTSRLCRKCNDYREEDGID